MSINPISGTTNDAYSGLSNVSDRQTFGAQVVTSTLDALNGQGGTAGASSGITDKASFGAAVVSKTLDYMNSGSNSSHGNEMAQSYDFAKNILSGYTANPGALTDINI